MLRRNLRRTLRYPASIAATVGIPLVFLLLFVFVFGDTMGAGLAGVAGGRDEYLDYVIPGILLLAAAGAAQGVAISVAMDMTEGIVARFRTMDIARVSVLTGHVAGSLIQTMVAHRRRARRRAGARLRARPRARSSGSRRSACWPLISVRADLAGGRARPGHQERRDGEQPADAAHPAALPRQRVRPDRVDAAPACAGSPSTSRSRR